MTTPDVAKPLTTQTSATANSLNAAIWQTADDYLRLILPGENYGDYILPFTVLRRLEGRLEASKEALLDLVQEETSKATDATLISLKIQQRFGLRFWNTSPLSLKRLAASDDALTAGLKQYINSFSPNIVTIFEAFEFDKLIDFLDRNNQLFNMVNHFASIDMSDEALGDQTMGDIFENLMYRSFSRKGKDAGEFYTPRDAIALMTSILFTSDDTELDESGIIRSVYDPTAGTCGMLIAARDALEAINPGIDVIVAGQELKESSFAMGQSDLLMRGFKDPNVLRFGNSLINDQFAGERFDYIMANPPYGSSWKSFSKEIKALQEAGDPRFAEGLPKVDDGQMLFLMHIADKLALAEGDTKGGRAAIVTNGSPLFAGSKGSEGIRKYLIGAEGGMELLDCIIALPSGEFYNTGIATYIWILDTNKEPHRRGKIQFIDATDLASPMRKNMGFKRVELRERDIQDITALYKEFTPSERSIIVTPDELTFRDVPMYKPQRLRVEVTQERIDAALKHKDAVADHEDVIREMVGVSYNDLQGELKKSAKRHGVKMLSELTKHIMSAISVSDETAPIARNAKGVPLADTLTKVIERVPYTEDVDDHMQRKVLPFVPDMMWDEDEAVVGTELPLTRLFYKPEEIRNLEQLDADIAESISWLTQKFSEVSE